MPQYLEKGVIRIFNREGKPVGTGFVVDEHLAVTCAHVAAAAQKNTPASVASRVRIQYQFDKSKQVAELVQLNTGLDDIAFLQLERIPDGVIPLKLAKAYGLNGHEYASLGYPGESGPVSNRRPLDRINGLVDATEPGQCQLLEIKGDEFYFGMSGSPVLDLVLDRVVGMVTSHRNLEHRNIVYAITADTIHKYWPELLIDETMIKLGVLPGMTRENRNNVREHLLYGLQASVTVVQSEAES